MKVLYFVFVCVSFYSRADGDSAPFVTACHAADTACLRSSAQRALPLLARGVPALGVGNMDPMRVDRVLANQSGLAMDFRNTDVTGLRHCTVDKLKRKGMQTYLDLTCSVKLVGQYELGGKLLFMPIEGRGRYIIDIRDILVKIMFQWEHKMVDGERHWLVAGWKHSTDVKTGVHYKFDNLFNNNTLLAKSIHDFANTNWREIYQELAPPIVKAIVSKAIDEIQNFFDRVPERELALD